MSADLCSVEGCLYPRRKRGWCGTHYSQWRTWGEIRPLHHTWATERVCVICGDPAADGRRKHCSSACSALDAWHKGTRPAAVACRLCGADVDLLAKGKGGRRRRSDVKMCGRCRQDRHKHKTSVHALAKRDGTTCGICQNTVDMTARKPDLMSPSVDHIVPVAAGGSNDPQNLQLAHLYCNHVKSDRHQDQSARSRERQVRVRV